MPTVPRYTVVVRDEEFSLSKNQLEFDSPNYFTAYFFGDFMESGSKTLTLDRNPDLFALIMEYLSGYTILPISHKALPRMMDERMAMQNLAEDAAFYGLNRLYALLTKPNMPKIDMSWSGFSGRVLTFEDLLAGKLPEAVSYTTAGLCSFDHGSSTGKNVVIYARNLPLRLVGNTELDEYGRPIPHRNLSTTVCYRLDLNRQQKEQLERQPYSMFEYDSRHTQSLIVGVFPESRLQLDGKTCRFEHFAQWWRVQTSPALREFGATANESAAQIFDDVFPIPFEDAQKKDMARQSECVVWADELFFVITARGFIAGRLQLQFMLLDVKARSKLAILDTLRPLVIPQT